jgi:hypothetical protein
MRAFDGVGEVCDVDEVAVSTCNSDQSDSSEFCTETC